MKIFNKSEGWNSKVNFVDENNVVLGYDTHQSCCECADWFISDKIEDKWADSCAPEGLTIELDGWVFDKHFQFIDVSSDSSYPPLDAGSCVVFRIVKGEDEKFIHLYNCHNGYYYHGFDFSDNETLITEGCL